MERPIRHVHVRRFHAPLAEVVALVDSSWSGGPLDAVPRALGGWRRTPAGAQGFAAGTRFGHGPFSFLVEHWDGRRLRARIETAGFRGGHGFEVHSEGDQVVVTHDLDAQGALPAWLVWQLFIARGHDWAVESLFDRMHVLLSDGGSSRARSRPPLGMRAFAATRRLFRRAGLASQRAANVPV
jgi:hypothetical protein